MQKLQDTITAQATVSGEGGIAIIRISGPESRTILGKVFKPASKEIIERRLTYGHVYWNDDIIDEVMAVYLPGPHTYTAENMAEIQCHGSQYIVRQILNTLMASGARMAEPGEFTYRAFANGRIDLSQAEAVMRLIHSSNERSRKSALRQMDGAVSKAIRRYQSQIQEVSAGLSAFIDFPDEIDEVETGEMIREKCCRIRDELLSECNESKGRIEDEGVFVALCGMPNAGKSSLLNALLGEDRAIVASIPGTTRDTISESIMLNGIRFTFTDTAGIRETENEVEQIGVNRARKAIESADIRLLLVDSSEMPGEELRAVVETMNPDIVLFSKDDISEKEVVRELLRAFAGYPVIQISVENGAGMDELRSWLLDYAESDLSQNVVFSQARHVEIAREAAVHLQDAVDAVDQKMPLDLVNIDLMAALESIGEITGESAAESVIDRVFSKFCVGK